MKRNTSIKYVIVILIFSTLTGSCKVKKEAATNKALYTLSASEVHNKIKYANTAFDFLEASGSAYIDSPDMKISGSFILRLEKDKRLWLRVQKFGFEGFRLLIENDSITLLNRLEKTYQKMAISQASKMTGLNLSQKEAIDLLAGNISFDEAAFIEMTQDSFLYHYKMGYNEYIAKHSYDALLMEVYHSTFSDLQNRTVEVDYSDFEMLNEQASFAFSRTIKSNDPNLGETQVDLKFKQVDIKTSLYFPFEIPSHYTRIY